MLPADQQVVLRPPAGGRRPGPEDELHPPDSRGPGRFEGHPDFWHEQLAAAGARRRAEAVPGLPAAGAAGAPAGGLGRGGLDLFAQRGGLWLPAGTGPGRGAVRLGVFAVLHRGGELHHLGDRHFKGLWGAAPVQPGVEQRAGLHRGAGALPHGGGARPSSRTPPCPTPWSCGTCPSGTPGRRRTPCPTST